MTDVPGPADSRQFALVYRFRDWQYVWYRLLTSCVRFPMPVSGDPAPKGTTVTRDALAFWVLALSTGTLAILAAVAIFNSPDNSMTILNMVLPVTASWVGTVLAYYFGRENFEAANRQMQQVVDRLTPQEQSPVSTIMREDITLLQIPAGQTEANITLSALRTLMTGDISRIPITDSAKHPRYMIHASALDQYLANTAGSKLTDSLATFLTSQKTASGKEYGVNSGFVLVSRDDTLAVARARMTQAGVQDILITANGTSAEPLVGWISNVRLARHLKT